MQHSHDFRQAQSSAPGNEGSSLFDTLLTTAPKLLSRYQNQLVAIRNMFGLELKLALKCGAFILALVLILSCVLLSSWVGLNFLLAYALLAIEAPIWSVVLAVVSFHVLAFAGLLRLIKSLVNEIGFKQSLSAFNSASADSNAAKVEV